MTCIAAARLADGSIILAADQQIAIRGGKDTWPRGKIFQRGKFAYGCAGYVRAANILRETFTEPERLESEDALRYLCGNWMNAWRSALEHGGCKVSINNEDSHGCTIVMVYEGRIYTISTDFSLVEANSYAAAGSGASEAMGAMYVAMTCNRKQAAQLGVMAAIAHDGGCGGEVDFIHIKNK